MGHHIQWINTADGVKRVAEKLAHTDLIAFDTEFIRETTFFPKVALMQFASRSEAWLVDPTVLTAEELEPLFLLLKDATKLKVLHAAFADQECLHWLYGFTAAPILDTAVAAALCGLGDNIGLGKLLKEALNISLPKGRARAKWLVRPLPPELLTYAEQDVAHLVELGETLLRTLEKRGRTEWAMSESKVDPSVFDISPDDMARRIARNGQMDVISFSALSELLAWREDRARTANLPRGWVADNDILISLAKVRPKTVAELRSFRGLNAKEVERNGLAIIAAIDRGIANPRALAPPPTARPLEREDHVFDFIRTYVSFLADKHSIALRFLINQGKAAQLVAHAAQGVEGWVKEGILSPHAAQLIGEDLQELLAGRRGLTLRNGRVEILQLDKHGA